MSSVALQASHKNSNCQRTLGAPHLVVRSKLGNEVLTHPSLESA